jgi:hypothetical protein
MNARAAPRHDARVTSMGRRVAGELASSRARGLGRIAAVASGVASALGVLGVIVAPREAHAFCRTVTTPIPASYSPRNGCFKEGLYLFWKNACVSFSINANATS